MRVDPEALDNEGLLKDIFDEPGHGAQPEPPTLDETAAEQAASPSLSKAELLALIDETVERLRSSKSAKYPGGRRSAMGAEAARKAGGAAQRMEVRIASGGAEAAGGAGSLKRDASVVGALAGGGPSQRRHTTSLDDADTMDSEGSEIGG